MSSFNLPTLEDTHGFLVALFKALLPQYDLSQGSFNWLWSRTQAGGVTDNHSHIANVENDLLPDTASGDMEDRWGTILGVPRKGATPARKSAALRVFGNSGTAVPVNQQLKHVSGLLFQIATAAVVGASGYVDCDVVGVSVGSQTRLNAGEILTFVATPVGLQDNATLQLNMDQDGVDQESDGAYQIRISNRLSSPPLGGAQNDFVQWALETVGIASAYAYPNRAGLGSVDVAALHAGSGTARVQLPGEVTALLASLMGLKPVAASVRVLTVTTRAIDIEYTVVPDGQAQNAFDWDDTVPPLVLSWNGTTRVLQFQGGSRPSTMVPGMRLTIKPAAGGGDGVQHTIQSLSGADSVVLQDVPVLAPVNGDTVYSGGPLVDPIRAAIQALVDSLGTANPDSVRYGAWEGNLRPGSIDRVSRSILGVLDGTVVAPATIQAANDFAYPSDGNIELLIAGHIIARAAH